MGRRPFTEPLLKFLARPHAVGFEVKGTCLANGNIAPVDRAGNLIAETDGFGDTVREYIRLDVRGHMAPLNKLEVKAPR